MREVKCFHCGNKKEKSLMFQGLVGKTSKNFCDENCYKLNREPIEYRKKIMAIIYPILNIRFEDGGSFINKKLKELDNYSISEVYNAICEIQFDMQMYVPTSGPVFARVNYMFTMIKSQLAKVDEQVVKTEEVKVVKTTEQEAKAIKDMYEEEYTPMKRANKKTLKQEVEELKIEF